MEKDRTTLSAWKAYETRVLRQAFGEISAASFWRSSGVAVLSFPLQYWAGLRPFHDTIIIVGITLGSGLIVFLVEFTFRLLRAAVKIMQEADQRIKKLEAEKTAQEAFVVTPKNFSPAYDLKIYGGGFDIHTMQNTRMEASLGVEPAVLKIRCHNLTPTPIILDEIQLLNADTSEVVVQQDAKAQRIDANGTCEIDIRLGSTKNPYREPPSWSGQVVIQTVRKGVFSSTPFKFGDLQPPRT
jgi:hypothetical protein